MLRSDWPVLAPGVSIHLSKRLPKIICSGLDWYVLYSYLCLEYHGFRYAQTAEWVVHSSRYCGGELLLLTGLAIAHQVALNDDHKKPILPTFRLDALVLSWSDEENL